MNLYLLIKWLHILSVLIFFFSHGISMGTAFKLVSEKKPDRLRALLDVSRWSLTLMSNGLIALLVFGLILTFMGPWWKQIWPWLSLVLLIAMSVWMTWQSRTVYSPIRRALGLGYMTSVGKENPPVEPASMDEVTALIAKSNPRLQTWVGLIFTVIILWLMIFKPF
jgi:hypothetical protein